MKRNGTLLKALLSVVFCFQAVFAHAGIVSVADLADMLDDENVRIVSARKPEDYGVVHIKNAVNVWHKDLYKDGDIDGLLKSPAKLAEIFGAKGISKGNKIVVYDGGKNKLSGRLYWVFEYLGCSDVNILDGQLKKWRKGRKPVTKDATAITATTFQASPNSGIIVTTAYVKGHREDANVVLVDVRNAEEFAGEEGEVERKGHIKGAINFDYENVLVKGSIKPKADLKQVVEAAGITSDKEVILYCETSVRAGIVYIALKSVLGYPNVKVYDGAYFEWAADDTNPVE
jgi:thiosulfate/3-mercaptopyruvate sulfurtransferase